MGTISQFFKRLGTHSLLGWISLTCLAGIENLRFKPAYNPYTEPSMEVFGYHPLLKRWVEVGNSGVFRPEMLRPMGFPDDVKVIAWGLSLERYSLSFTNYNNSDAMCRPTMIKYGISNIRDLVGHKVSLDFIKENPICRLDE